MSKKDGKILEIYNESNSELISNKITCLKYSYPNLWIGTDKGLSKFDGKNWESFIPDEDLLTFKILDIAILDSNIWLGTNEGLWKLNGNHLSRVFKDYFVDSHNDIYNILVDSNKCLWFIGRHENYGLYKYNLKELIKIRIPDTISVTNPIINDEKGTIWMGSRNGIVSFANNSWRTYTLDIKYGYNNPYFVKTDNSGNIWFDMSLNIGIFSKNNQSLSYFKSKNSFEQNNYHDILFDENNNPYLIKGNGVEDYAHNKIYKFQDNNLIKEYIASSWLENNKLLVITNEQCFILENEVLSELKFDKGLIGNIVQIVKEGNRGDIWIGTEKGINYINKGEKKQKQLDKDRIERYIDSARYQFTNIPEGKYYHESVYDSVKNCIWVAFDSLYEFKKGIWKSQGIELKGRTRGCNNIFMDKEKKLWALGKSNNVYLNIGATWKEFKPGQELLTSNIRGYEVLKSAVVIIHEKGLSVYHNEKWELYSFSEPTYSTYIYNDGTYLWYDNLYYNEIKKFENNEWATRKLSIPKIEFNNLLGIEIKDAISNWIITSKMVLILKDKSYSSLLTINKLSENINCYVIDSKNRLIIGTTSGLGIRTENSWNFINAKNGLLSSNVEDLYLLSNGKLLIKHPSGLSIIDISKF
jgi:ligand-binding sensor domain-containing protein